MATYTYYPGCSVMGINRSYDVAARAVSEYLGLKLDELEDWNCCGATVYFSISELKAHSLSARNLALAEKKNRRDLVTICNACYTTLTKTNDYMARNPSLKRTMDGALAAAGLSYSGKIHVRHFLDVLVNDVGEQSIRAKVTKPLKGLKVAPYYGCQIGRPFAAFDDPEYPMTMDQLLTWLGAEVVPFPMKAKCCGGMLMTTNEKVGVKLTGSILECAQQNGADVVASACPLCQANLELFQGRINKLSGTHYKIPVVAFTQLVGLAFGMQPEKLALGREVVPVRPALERFMEVPV